MLTHDHERLELLLDRWEEARRHGRPVSTATFCADAPDLHDLFALRVRLIELAEQSFELTGSIAPSALETAMAGPHPSAGAGPAAPREWLTAGDVLDGLVLVRPLGYGGMGEVWEARDNRLNRPVAIKFLRAALMGSEAARRRFGREAMACAAVQHENVVAVYNVGEHRGSPYLVMPLLEGENLASRLRRTPQLPMSELARIGRAVAAGLAAMHARGLTHRDIKPSNIWLCADGTVKVLDLGLAVFRDGLPEDDPLTGIAGTPAYMSPEQLRGGPVAPGSDLFSLGVVFWQMATGRNPFFGQSVRESLSNLLTVTPSPPSAVRPDLPAEFDTLVLDLLAKDPNDRHPTSALGVIDRLEPLTVERVGVAPLPAKRPTRRWVAVAAALALLAVVGGLVWAALAAPSADERVRQAGVQLRERAVESTRCEEKTGGVFKNLRQYEFTYTGRTGLPVCTAVKEGTAVIKVPYTGEYSRRSRDLIMGVPLPFTVPEGKTIGGVLELTVSVGGGRVRMTDYKLVPTIGDVMSLTHDANVSAEVALLSLVREVLGAE